MLGVRQDVGELYFIQGRKLGREDSEKIGIFGCTVADSCAHSECDGVWGRRGWWGWSNIHAQAHGHTETNRYAQTYGYTKTNIHA
jgi:hypothetical protein